MIRYLLLGCSLLACTACGTKDDDAPYNLGAFERPDPEWPEEKFFVQNARRLLPATLTGCGIRDFREVRGEEGEVVFTFRIAVRKKLELSQCIEKRMPRGTHLNPVYIL